VAWNVTVHPVVSFSARCSGVGTLRLFTKVKTISLVVDPPAGTFETAWSWLPLASTQVVLGRCGCPVVIDLGGGCCRC